MAGTIRLGHDSVVGKHVSVLNSVISIAEGGPDGGYLALEPDPAHGVKLLASFGHSGGKRSVPPEFGKRGVGRGRQVG